MLVCGVILFDAQDPVFELGGVLRLPLRNQRKEFLRRFHLNLLLVLLLDYILEQPDFLLEINELMRINIEHPLTTLVRLVGI